MAQFGGHIAIANDGFAASAADGVERWGPLEVVRLHGGAIAGALLGRIPAAKDSHYGCVLVVRGTLRSQHYGHQATLAAGDFLLVDGREPSTLELDLGSEAMVLRVSARTLRIYLPSPEQLCGRPLRSGSGICDDVAQLLNGVLLRFDDEFPEAFRKRIGRNLLDTLATAFSLGLGGALHGSAVVCSRNARVRLYIERNLRDPDLRPTSIAAKMRLSSRYLRLIFAANEETVSAYILRRRLEECARELASPDLAHQSITQIAFGWGFNSGPHFTRSFRNRFDMAPREYRRLAARNSPARRAP